MSIEVNKVSKLYGNQKVLDEVSFKINQGEIVGFLGENGAGKSTMMKILTSYISPNSGKVKVLNFDVTKNSFDIRKNIGYLPENNPLYLDMYVKEFLEYNAKIHHLPKSKAQEVIYLTDIYDEAHKKIGKLSKGYKQRVGLAHALIHDPKVLILDEPTTGLDPNQLEGIRNLIKNFKGKKTILLSTHIMQEVKAMCDRVLIIKKGKILKDIYLKDIANNFVIVEFEKLIEKSVLSKIENVTEVEKLGGNIWQIKSKDVEKTKIKISDFAFENQLKILKLEVQQQSLDSFFKQTTKKNIPPFF